MPQVFTDNRSVSAQEMSRMAAAIAGTYVFPTASGGAVTSNSNMAPSVAAITARTGLFVNGTHDTTGYAGGTVTISTADVTNPRRDWIYYDGAGGVGVTAGTPAAVPVLPNLTAGRIGIYEVYVAAGDTSIDAGDLIDRRANNVGVGLDTGAQRFVEHGISKGFFALGPAPAEGAADGAHVGLGCTVQLTGGTAVSGTGANAGMWLFTASGASNFDAGAIGPLLNYVNDWTMSGRATIPSVANTTVFLGAKTSANFVDENGVIGFRVSGTGNLTGVCDSGGTETTRDYGATGATEFSWRIEVRSAGTIVRFYVNGAQVGADVTTNIPTADLYAVNGVRNTSTDQTLRVADWFGWREV